MGFVWQNASDQIRFGVAALADARLAKQAPTRLSLPITTIDVIRDSGVSGLTPWISPDAISVSDVHSPLSPSLRDTDIESQTNHPCSCHTKSLLVASPKFGRLLPREPSCAPSYLLLRVCTECAQSFVTVWPQNPPFSCGLLRDRKSKTLLHRRSFHRWQKYGKPLMVIIANPLKCQIVSPPFVRKPLSLEPLRHPPQKCTKPIECEM